MSDGSDDVTIIVAALIAAAVVTWIVARLLGRIIAKRSLVLARFITALFVPGLTLTFGIVRARADAAAHPLSDWPAMGLLAMIIASIVLLAATVPTTMLSLPRR